MSDPMGFQKLNIHLLKAASAIRSLFSEVYEPKLIRYDFNCEDTIDITGMNSESALNTYNVDYFWIELNERFRISLFYKDFDAGTGNIHVIPGILQIWEKDAKKPKKSLDEMLSKGRGIFRENEWSPLIEKPKFLWNFKLSEVEEVLRDNLPDEVFLQDRPDNSENTCMDIDNYLNFFKNGFDLKLDCEEPLKQATGKYYSVMYWKNHSRPIDGFFYTLYLTRKDRNGLWWTRYGDIQFWSHEHPHGKGNTPHEWDGIEGWTLYYPVANETPKFPPRAEDSGMNIYEQSQDDVNKEFERYCKRVLRINEPHGFQI